MLQRLTVRQASCHPSIWQENKDMYNMPAKQEGVKAVNKTENTITITWHTPRAQHSKMGLSHKHTGSKQTAETCKNMCQKPDGVNWKAKTQQQKTKHKIYWQQEKATKQSQQPAEPLSYKQFCKWKGPHQNAISPVAVGQTSDSDGWESGVQCNNYIKLQACALKTVMKGHQKHAQNKANNAKTQTTGGITRPATPRT